LRRIELQQQHDCNESRVPNHRSDGHLEQLRLGGVELVEQRQRLVDHLVVLVVRQILHGQPVGKYFSM